MTPPPPPTPQTDRIDRPTTNSGKLALMFYDARPRRESTPGAERELLHAMAAHIVGAEQEAAVAPLAALRAQVEALAFYPEGSEAGVTVPMGTSARIREYRAAVLALLSGAAPAAGEE